MNDKTKSRRIEKYKGISRFLADHKRSVFRQPPPRLNLSNATLTPSLDSEHGIMVFRYRAPLARPLLVRYRILRDAAPAGAMGLGALPDDTPSRLACAGG